MDSSEVILTIVRHHLYEEWAAKLLSDLVDLFKPSISNKRLISSCHVEMDTGIFQKDSSKLFKTEFVDPHQKIKSRNVTGPVGQVAFQQYF